MAGSTWGSGAFSAALISSTDFPARACASRVARASPAKLAPSGRPACSHSRYAWMLTCAGRRCSQVTGLRLVAPHSPIVSAKFLISWY